jgi:hypothetical protein
MKEEGLKPGTSNEKRVTPSGQGRRMKDDLDASLSAVDAL